MKVYSRYEDYLAALCPLKEETPVYLGELLARSLISDTSYEGKVVCFLWKNEASMEVCKIRLENGIGETLAIGETPVSLDKDELVWRAIYDPEVKIWLNLCHFREGEDVRYDPYYDALPAFESAAVTMAELRAHMKAWISENLLSDDVDTVFLYGDSAQDNIVTELLSSVSGISVHFMKNEVSVPDHVRKVMTRRVLLESSSGQTIFGHFAADDVINGHEPDIRFGDIQALVLEVRPDTDMMGNRFLNVRYLDGNATSLVKLNERFL